MNMKNAKILILISRIVALPNAFWCSAAQLPQLSWAAQNSILLLPARNHSTLATPRFGSVENLNLNPWRVTGFVDAEGCFHVSITERKDRKLGWAVVPRFSIGLHIRDKGPLEDIKKFFGAGQITRYGPQSLQFLITNQKDLASVYSHFKKWKLISNKEVDFELWGEVLAIIKSKEHLTLGGLHQILAIKASINLGLSEKHHLSFPGIVPVIRPVVSKPKIIDPNWIAGFTSGESSFMIKITASQMHSIGYKVFLVLKVTQDSRDAELMVYLKEYLGCGDVYNYLTWSDYIVTKYEDITFKIIPFFKKYRTKGVKALDFADLSKAAELMKQKKHLTPEGLYQIRNIKAGMNRGRKLD